MKLTQTLAAALIASVAGISFAAEAPAPAAPATTAEAPAKVDAKKPVHRKHHKKAAKKQEAAKKTEAAAPATK